MNKKSQLNKAFVYILSIIIIAFAAYLVINFIFSFSSIVDESSESRFYNTLSQDYNTVFRTYGSQQIFEYRLTQNTELVCFISNSNCISEIPNISDRNKDEIQIAYSANSNVFTIGRSGIESFGSIGSFSFKPEECSCIQPINQRFRLVIENSNNNVHISHLDSLSG